MKKLSLAFLVVLLSVVALTSALTTASAAPAIKAPFSATITGNTGPPQSPKRFWIDEEGITHFRGLVVPASITGDINGDMEITENANVDSFGYGDVQVKAVITVGTEEAYRMSFDGTLSGGVTSGTFVIDGMGSCKGIHITGTLTPTSTGAELTGTKLTTKP